MILMLNKTFDDLTTQANAELTKIGFTTSPGSIAKLLLNIVNTELADFYNALTVNHTQAFLSTAKDEFLDAIGFLLNCKRQDSERDDEYKFRISKQILLSATANETAIRLAALSVEGVEDIVLKKFSYGAGSFTVFIITDQPVADISIIENVRTSVEKTAGYGIKFDIANPTLNPVKMKIKLLIKDSVSDIAAQDIKFLVRNSLKDYLTSLSIGDSIIINEITQRIMEVNSNIVSYTCEEFRINNKMAIYINQQCRWNERFMLSSEPEAILV